MFKSVTIKFYNYNTNDYILWYLYYYMRNNCNLTGLQLRYFSLIWNTYMWKLQNLCRVVV